MNYLFNDRNLVRSSVLSALNIEPSSAIYRTDTAAKAGGGSVSVTGPYTGSHDTTIDVEILDSTGDSSQVSEPVFSGVGNGTMTGAAVTALDPQDITVTLVDLGTPTLSAQAPFQGATLVAKTSGPSGNAIVVSIDANGIVREDSIYSTQHAISAGTNSFTGSEWNFGALALINGKLDPATPRIAFGDDPQVYRPYKVYDASQGQYVYSFSPAPIRDVPAFVTVKNVTGTWTVHITDGVSPEDFSGIVTLYDALSAIQAGSDLVSVDGVVVNDLTPNGQGANDLSVWTDSYVLSVIGTGSDFVQRNPLQVAVQSAAPTETLRVKCIDASVTGSERWDVAGDISGDLGTAISGEAFTAGSYGLTVPLQLPSGTPPNGNINVDFNPVPRAEGEQEPHLDIVQAVLGALAHNASYTFQLVKKPAPDCPPDNPTGEPSADCLGIEPEGGGVVSASNKRLVRLQLLTAAVATIVRANTSPIANADIGDVQYMQSGGSMLLKGLDDISPVDPFPAWVATHPYVVDDIIAPGDGYRYRCTTAGTSHTSAPTFVHTTAYTSTTTETTGVVWTVMEKDHWGIWDDALAGFKTDVDDLSDLATGTATVWTAATAYVEGDKVMTFGNPPGSTSGDALDRKSFFYECTASGTSGAISNEGFMEMQSGKATVTGDGSCEWKCIGIVVSGLLIKAGQVSVDIAYSGYSIDDYLEARYGSLMDNARAAAGIDPNFKGASTDGDGCWQDYNDNQFWFKNTDGVLLPFQQGHGYHSAKLQLDPLTGKLVPTTTKEFFIKLRFYCDLKPGDSFTVTISDVSGGSGTYQPGDEWDVSVAHADPLQLGGGQDGDDTLTWSVTSSISTAFAPYALVTTALAPYDDGGLTFQITPGGIDFALGDSFRLSVEGGHFHWRRDGGSWSSSTVIGDTSASDGLTIVFAGGAAPSWVAGDAWSFAAEATNGPDRAKSPTDGRFAWVTSTTLTIVPDDPADCTRFAVFDHHIPSDATITLQGSDDGFSTTPTSIPITWTARNLFVTFAAVTRAAWRLVVNRPGDCFWAFLGQQMQPSFTNHVNGQTGPDVGHFTRRRRAAGVGVRAGIGGDVLHDVVSADSLADFETGFDYACANDDGGFGLVINDAAGETALVRFTGTDIETKDQVFDYQAPRGARYQTFTVPVEALP